MIIDVIADTGNVMTHDLTIFFITLKLTPDNPPATPTPIMEPIRVCVVETGSPIKLFAKTTDAVENSAENPRVGVNSVIFVPTVSITL